MLPKLDEIKLNCAEELFKAENKVKEISPLTERYEHLTIKDAYDIQLKIAEWKENQGKKIIGKKVGLTSQAMQDMLGVNEPDYGHLFDDMQVKNKSVIDTTTMIAPKVEAEIGFKLKKDLIGPGITYLDVIMATDYVLPTLEIIDSRIADWDIKLIDTVADNGSSSKVVLGRGQKPLNEIDLRTNGMVLKKNNEIVATGAGAAALGNPAKAIAWLANRLSDYGISLKKEELILPGALSGALAVNSGEMIQADFGSLGDVEVTFQ